MTEHKQKDKFGLPKMTTNQEVAISFTLFMLGTLLVVSGLYSLKDMADMGPAYVGIIMMGTGYLFAIESIREFEEKDHFLSRKLMKKD